MSDVRVSVIIPTVGRDTLEAAKESARDADEVIVVPNQDGDHGYTARTKGASLATGTHLAFLDDDDVYAEGAIDAMRDAACDFPVVFKMDHPVHGILWREPHLVFGNVGTPMMLVPNRPAELGVWEEYAPGLKEPGGDFSFLRGCCQKMGGPVWRDEVVAVIRPHERRSVAVVTPWKDHPELLADYEQAIRMGPEPAEVIVVQDEDGDGFSPTCNKGLADADSEIVVFLNNDIVATKQGWLHQLVSAVEPGVLVGAKLRTDRHGDVDGQPMPYLDGWCLAGMREDFLEIGGWDEGFEEPSYYGDNDLCFRARLAGMTLREIPVGLVHKGGVTTGQHADAWALPSTIANRERYMARVRELLVVA